MPRLAPEARNAGSRVNDPTATTRRWSCHLCDAAGVEATLDAAATRLELHYDSAHLERP